MSEFKKDQTISFDDLVSGNTRFKETIEKIKGQQTWRAFILDLQKESVRLDKEKKKIKSANKSKPSKPESGSRSEESDAESESL